MATRRILWAVVGLFSVLVLAGSATLGYLLLRSRAAPIQLVVAGGERLRMIADNRERELDSNVNVQQYRFPAATPDGRKLAYVVQDGDTMRIIRRDLVSDERTELYSSATTQPFALAWSPDGRYVTFLGNGANGLTTYLVADDGAHEVQVVTSGQAAYLTWRHDGGALLLHVNNHFLMGGRMELYQPAQKSATRLLDNPGFFQAPAWSVDGQSVFYVAQPPFPTEPPKPVDVQGDIVRVTAEGTNPQVLASEPQADVRMVRAPTNDQIAYIALRGDTNILGWGPLKLVDGATGEKRIISPPDAHVAFFFWSPDGKRIAYLTYTGEFVPGGERTWHVVDVASGTVQNLTTFTPSRSFAELEIFFDAYLHALSPWSPDGTRLAYGAEDGVYVLDLASGKAVRAAEGAMGVWVGGK